MFHLLKDDGDEVPEYKELPYDYEEGTGSAQPPPPPAEDPSADRFNWEFDDVVPTFPETGE